MTKDELWEEFENQLIRETRTSMTMNFDTAERMTKLGIKETVAKWKDRLEQEPCEDAVSRASVFEILGNLMSIPYDLDRPINKDDVSESMDAIRVLPSVTPAPKKCHNENHDYAECDQFICSNCGIELQDWHRVKRDEDDGDVTYHGYEFKYCPNCGSFIMKEV